MANASLCLPSHERKSTSPHSGRPEKRQPSSSLDQPVASVSGRGNSDHAYRCGHEIHRRRNEARFWNANYVGTHFGGSLFAMTDAFYMLMHHLGRDYPVWDNAATILYN